jgi:hypothetical protein
MLLTCFHFDSLGGALATMAAFKIAGENKPWIPKPITCISYASPFVGSAGFRAAHVVRILNYPPDF